MSATLQNRFRDSVNFFHERGEQVVGGLAELQSGYPVFFKLEVESFPVDTEELARP